MQQQSDEFTNASAQALSDPYCWSTTLRVCV